MFTEEIFCNLIHLKYALDIFFTLPEIRFIESRVWTSFSAWKQVLLFIECQLFCTEPLLFLMWSRNHPATESLLDNAIFSVRRIRIRYRPRFFYQVGHQTTYASIGNRHFFTISCHHQTYQNEQSWQKMGSFLENKVCTLKINVFEIFRKIPLIFGAEKWLWKYKLCKLWGGCS